MIAVALFAALSYAVTQSGRGGGDTKRETASLDAAQLIQNVGQLQQALQRLRIVGGCTDTQISFAHDTDGNGTIDSSDSYYNPASLDPACWLFSPIGGGLHPGVIAGGLVTGSSRAIGHGTAAEELIFRREVSREICAAINAKAFGDADALPLDASVTGNAAFAGAYGGSSRVLGDEDATIAGKSLGCLINGGGLYYLFAVLWPR